MVVVIREDATPDERAQLMRLLAEAEISCAHTITATTLGDVLCIEPGEPGALSTEVYQQLAAQPAVKQLVRLPTPYHLASRALQPEKTIVRVGEALIGGADPVIIAGPCSVESEAQMIAAAQAAAAAGAHLLRGGAFKPRTSPYSFQGLGLEGLDLLVRAGHAAGLPVVTEVMEPGLVPAVAEAADMLQIGSRNMQNYALLRAAGRSGRPVLLKRGFAATIEEWLLAAEYILAEGNPHVVLCERGLRSFDPQTRNLLDLACVPLLHQLTHLPVIVDPSHGTGKRDLVVPMSVAAIAAGADGVIVEMHPQPERARSDAAQTIDPSALRQLAMRAAAVRAALQDMSAFEADGEALVC